MYEPTDKLLPLELVARRVRVTARWLRDEIDAGRIPHLRAGRRVLLDPEIVEAALLRRARGDVPPTTDNGGAK